jgi:hypothetical protein
MTEEDLNEDLDEDSDIDLSKDFNLERTYCSICKTWQYSYQYNFKDWTVLKTSFEDYTPLDILYKYYKSDDYKASVVLSKGIVDKKTIISIVFRLCEKCNTKENIDLINLEIKKINRNYAVKEIIK